jgi:flagellar biosynthesis protein FlhA
MVNQSLRLDHIRIELGYELLQVVDQNKEYKLTDQIKDLRKQIAKDLGFILPVVRIQDNLQLQAREYQIKVKDIICGRYELQPSRILLMNPNGGSIDIAGDEVTEPVFNLPAKWVDRAKQDEAVNQGYTVVEPITIISTHLSEVVKENITELLTYSETKKLLANLDEEQKKLADEVVPNKISVVSLQRILQKLLNESVNIRDLPAILEAIAEISDITTNNGLMVEHIRARLAKQICFSLLNDDNIIPLVILSQEWEKAFFESLVGDDNNKQLAMPPSRLQEFVKSVNILLENLARSNVSPILLTSNALRPFVRSVTERFKPNLMILSHNEIYPKIRIKNYGQVN